MYVLSVQTFWHRKIDPLYIIIEPSHVYACLFCHRFCSTLLLFVVQIDMDETFQDFEADFPQSRPHKTELDRL